MKRSNVKQRYRLDCCEHDRSAKVSYRFKQNLRMFINRQTNTLPLFYNVEPLVLIHSVTKRLVSSANPGSFISPRWCANRRKMTPCYLLLKLSPPTASVCRGLTRRRLSNAECVMACQSRLDIRFNLNRTVHCSWVLDGARWYVISQVVGKCICASTS